jgi:hypothetical protein
MSEATTSGDSSGEPSEKSTGDSGMKSGGSSRSTPSGSRSSSGSSSRSPLDSSSSIVSGLPTGPREWLDAHMAVVENLIVERAHSQNGDRGITPMDIADAAKVFAPGKSISEVKGAWRVGFTTWCALLTLAFGFLGLLAGAGKLGTAPGNAQGWLDIAKVFAGAVVGSSGAEALSRRRS